VSERQGLFETMEVDPGWQGREPRRRRWKLAAVMAVVLLLLGANAPVRTDNLNRTKEFSDRLLESSPVTHDVPIPATAVLLGTGLMGLVLLRRRPGKK
jgi:hypothetical protein